MKSDECGRNCSREVSLAALSLQLEGNLLVLGGLASELNLQIGVDRRRCRGRFGQASAYGDYGKLRAARDLQHVKIAVAVSGIKRLDGYRDQELALARVANAFPFRRMAHTLGLMQGVRHVVSESGLLEESIGHRLRQTRGELQEKKQSVFSYS